MLRHSTVRLRSAHGWYSPVTSSRRSRTQTSTGSGSSSDSCLSDPGGALPSARAASTGSSTGLVERTSTTVATLPGPKSTSTWPPTDESAAPAPTTTDFTSVWPAPSPLATSASLRNRSAVSTGRRGRVMEAASGGGAVSWREGGASGAPSLPTRPTTAASWSSNSGPTRTRRSATERDAELWPGGHSGEYKRVLARRPFATRAGWWLLAPCSAWPGSSINRALATLTEEQAEGSQGAPANAASVELSTRPTTSRALAMLDERGGVGVLPRRYRRAVPVVAAPLPARGKHTSSAADKSASTTRPRDAA
mmetsp:Transcript_1336/g.5321  ORF Transcript_1336/g.5321 Transcript_1336/m.5321 type:complete len:308 (-) Transcript_1336:73-996(-)